MKEPWQMTQAEFIATEPLRTIEVRPITFEQWAKEKEISIPAVDMGRVFGMAMEPNKTRHKKGQWKAELKRCAQCETLRKQYEAEIKPVPKKVKANHLQAGVLHKRKVRKALSEGKPVPYDVLKDYPSLT